LYPLIARTLKGRGAGPGRRDPGLFPDARRPGTPGVALLRRLRSRHRRV